VAKYTGSCHCGQVRFEVDADIAEVGACNCSMCRRAGTLLAFVPATRFTLLSGAEALTSYQFNKHVIDHVFCSRCGIKPFARGAAADGTPMVAVNARCLDGVDADTQFKVNHFDGASL